MIKHIPVSKYNKNMPLLKGRNDLYCYISAFMHVCMGGEVMLL